MKTIETNGITFLEHLAEKSEWYCGTDYTCGDLYEAEEIYAGGGVVKPNRLIFVHNPGGEVVEPIRLSEDQYFGRPTEIAGVIYILLVDFGAGIIRIVDCGAEFKMLKTLVEISLKDVEDCYNLLLRGIPLMLTRQGGNTGFEILWPYKVSFPIGQNESFLYKRDEKYIFSRWFEDPEYREEIVVRDSNGLILEVIQGSIFITPNGEEWVLK